LIGIPTNVAVTDLADVIVTMQLTPETASHPVHGLIPLRTLTTWSHKVNDYRLAAAIRLLLRSGCL
jgi:hypothetical protein